MTAFSRRADQNQWGTAVWELRSVNHRYLEVVFRLPDSVRELEPILREHIKQKVQRGKLECFLKYLPQVGTETTLSVNTELVTQLTKAANQVSQLFSNSISPNVMEIISWPGVINITEANVEAVHSFLLQLFDQALQDLILSREQEGEAISHVVKERLVKTSKLVSQVKRRLPSIVESQRKKLVMRFEEAKIKLNHERLEQERVLIAQKVDIAEEVERLEMHIEDAQNTLQKGGVVGRRLDFLMQELNREANTIAAKSVDSEISAIAVELRVLIEQMREQVQNVE